MNRAEFFRRVGLRDEPARAFVPNIFEYRRVLRELEIPVSDWPEGEVELREHAFSSFIFEAQPGVVLPWLPLMRVRSLEGQQILDRCIPDALRDTYIRAFTYQGLPSEVPFHLRCWGAIRVETDFNLSVRRGEYFVHVVLRVAERADRIVLNDLSWHITLARLNETLDVFVLMHALRELQARLLDRQCFAFWLEEVDWEHPERYVHFRVLGPLALVSAEIRTALLREFDAHVSGATRRSAGVLHVAIPVYGRHIPTTPL
jgi:hypothetical protein